MLSVSPATRVFLAVQPIDMRRSFTDVQTVFGQDPLTGHLFLYQSAAQPRQSPVLGRPELFDSASSPGTDSFRGTLELYSDVPVNALALIQSPGELATLPVITSSRARTGVSFAHFAAGPGITSTVILVNPSRSTAAEGTLRLLDYQGHPMRLRINDQSCEGEFQFQVPARGVRYIEVRALIAPWSAGLRYRRIVPSEGVCSSPRITA